MQPYFLIKKATKIVYSSNKLALKLRKILKIKFSIHSIQIPLYIFLYFKQQSNMTLKVTWNIIHSYIYYILHIKNKKVLKSLDIIGIKISFKFYTIYIYGTITELLHSLI